MCGHQRMVQMSSYMSQWVAFECLLSFSGLLPFPRKVLFIFLTFPQGSGTEAVDTFWAGGAILWFSAPLKWGNVFGSYWHFQTAFIKCPIIIQSLGFSLWFNQTLS